MRYILTVLCVMLVPCLRAETLTLKVNQLRSLKGNLIVYLWKDPDSYLLKSQADYQMIVDLEKPENAPVNGIIDVKIDQLAKGPYAMMMVHDENRSYNFERNVIGIPLEGFAFGNNAKPNLGAPKFQEAAIDIANQSVTQTISLTY